MKVVSTNIAEPRIVSWRGKQVTTGIFKKPVDHPIELGLTDVVGDHVIDRRYHGGEDKACYLYSTLHYSFWKEQYPNLDWHYGMFGENLTIEGLDEESLKIGATYKVGSAIIQISQPRQPCFKLGIRFNDQKILRKFIEHPSSGAYVRILKPGKVNVGDIIQEFEIPEDGISVAEIYRILYAKKVDPVLLKKALKERALAESCRRSLR